MDSVNIALYTVVPVIPLFSWLCDQIYRNNKKGLTNDTKRIFTLII